MNAKPLITYFEQITFSDRFIKVYFKDLINTFVLLLLLDPMCNSKEESRSYSNKIVYLNCSILRVPQ
jgi:hypothetical protein